MKKITLLVFYILLVFCYAEETPAEFNGSPTIDPASDNNEYRVYGNNDIMDYQKLRMIYEMRRRNGDKDDVPVYREKPTVKKNFFADGRTAFALGLAVDISASNSYFNIEDFFKKTLEINIKKMAENKQGFSLSAMVGLNFYFDVYIKSKYEFGIFLNADTFVYNNIPQKLIGLVGNGLTNDSGLKGNVSEYAYAFFDTGLFYGMKINAFKFRTSASYFIPIMYCNSVISEYEYYNDPVSGGIIAFGKTNIDLYSPLPLSGKPITKKDIDNIFSSAGFDITFTGSYDISPYADIHFSLCNIPIVPGNLSNGISVNYQGKIEVSSLVETLNGVIDGKFKQPDVTMDYSSELLYTLNKKKIFRPLKFAIGSNIFPFQNKYLIITPSLGMHILKPIYVDFGLRLETQFLNVMGLYYSLNRLDRVYKNTLGFFLDLRIFRMEFAASSASPSFAGSFTGKGVEAYLQIVLGY